MRHLHRLTVSLLAGVAVYCLGCGGSSSSGSAAGTATNRAARRPLAGTRLTAPQRAEVRRRRRQERAHFSSPAIARAIRGVAPAQRRAALLRAVRRAVARDARQRIARGQIKGPLRGVSCQVASDDRQYAQRHPNAPLLRYRCLAVSFRAATSPPMVAGTDFVARVDFEKARFVWCLFVPVGGEGTHTALSVAVQPPAACVAPPPDAD